MCSIPRALGAAVAVCLSATAGLAQAPFKFIVVNIPSLTSTVAVGPNASGQSAISGYLMGSMQSRAYLREPDGHLLAVQYPGSASTSIVAINDSGTLLGRYDYNTSAQHAFLRTSGGLFINVDFPGAASTFASAMNNNGDIAGSYSTAAGAVRGFVRLSSGEFQDLGTLDGARAINTKREIAGNASSTAAPGPCLSGFIRTSEGAVSYFPLSGTCAEEGGGTGGAVYAMNDGGDVFWNVQGCCAAAGSPVRHERRTAAGTLSSFEMRGPAPEYPELWIQSTNSLGEMGGYFGTPLRTAFVTRSCGAAASISPVSRTFLGTGDAGTVNVTAPAGCSWGVQWTPVDWITITRPAVVDPNGASPAILNYTVQPNTSSAPRTAILEIAGQPFTIVQDGGSCTYALEGQSAFSAGGSSVTLKVVTPVPCSWTVQSNANWIHVSGAASGQGPGSVTVQVDPNQDAAKRTGTLSVAGTTFRITQETSCPLSFTSLPTFPVDETTTLSGFTVAEGCPVVAEAKTPWITITDASRTEVKLRFAANLTGAPRVGTISLNGTEINYTQLSSDTQQRLYLYPPALSFAAASGEKPRAQQFNIAAQYAQGFTASVHSPASLSSTTGRTASWIDVTEDAAGLTPGKLYPDSVTITRSIGGSFAAPVRLYVRNPGCDPTATMSSSSVLAAGTPVVLDVSASANCEWRVSSRSAGAEQSMSGAGTQRATFSVSTAPQIWPVTQSVTLGEHVFNILRPAPHRTVFSDVASSDPISEYAALMWSNGITNGCAWPPLQYCPNDFVTREQMAAFIIRSIYSSDVFPYPAEPYFDDVPASSPFFKHIQKMKELGITGGCTARQYCPATAVTRGQMAAFVMKGRLGDGFDYPAAQAFSDVPASHMFFKYVQKMKSFGITMGCSPTEYCPDAPTTRGQMAVFIIRAFFTPWF